jgi:hypothetical protein
MPAALAKAWGNGSETNAEVIREVLSNDCGKVLPWSTVSDVINNALRSRFIERSVDSGAWPCSAIDANRVKLSLRQEVTQKTARVVQRSAVSYSPAEDRSGSATNGTEHNTQSEEALSYVSSGILAAEATLQNYELQDLIEHMQHIVSVCGDLGLAPPTFRVRIEFDVSTVSLREEDIERLDRALQEASERFRIS